MKEYVFEVPAYVTYTLWAKSDAAARGQVKEWAERKMNSGALHETETDNAVVGVYLDVVGRRIKLRDTGAGG